MESIQVIVNGIKTSSGTYKNIVLKGDSTFGSQVTQQFVIYHIRWDFDLNGRTVKIPANCVLKMEGGKISNGTLVGNNTLLIYDTSKEGAFDNVTFDGTWIDCNPKESNDLLNRVKDLEDIAGDRNYSNILPAHMGRITVKPNVIKNKIGWALYTNIDNFDYLIYISDNKVYIPYDPQVDEALVSDGGSEFMEFAPTSQAWQAMTDVFGQYYLMYQGDGVNKPDGTTDARQDLDAALSNDEIPYYVEEPKNILTQDMLSKRGTIYTIQYNFDLDGKTIVIPENCVIKFEGGRISNGTLVGNNTLMVYHMSKESALVNVTLNGTWIDNQDLVKINEEDLEFNQNGELQFADRDSDAAHFAKYGIKIIRKNVVGTVDQGGHWLKYVDENNSDVLVYCQDGVFYLPYRHVIKEKVISPLGKYSVGIVQYPLDESNIREDLFLSDDDQFLYFDDDNGKIIMPDGSTVTAGYVIETNWPLRDYSEYKVQNVLTQDQFDEPNTTYIIKYDFTLDGKTIRVPDNSIIKFEGGSISDGTLAGNNVILIYDRDKEDTFDNITFDGTFIHKNGVDESKIDDAISAAEQAHNDVESIKDLVGDRDASRDAPSHMGKYYIKPNIVQDDDNIWALYTNPADGKDYLIYVESIYDVYIPYNTQTGVALIADNGRVQEYALSDIRDLTTRFGSHFISYNQNTISKPDGTTTSRIEIDNACSIGNLPYYQYMMHQDANILNTDQVLKENTIYIVQHDFDLYGKTLTIPNNCILYFDGGSFKNGTVVLNDTLVLPTYNNLLNTQISAEGKAKGRGTTAQRPTLGINSNKGFEYFDTDLNTIIIWNGLKWVTKGGFTAAKTKGGLADRPTSILGSTDDGFEYYDTGLKKYIYFRYNNGNPMWVEADGFKAGIERAGIYEDRPDHNWLPTGTNAGFQYFATDLGDNGQVIVWNGTEWVIDSEVAQMQSDWNVTDITSAAYIKNKPTIPSMPDLSNYYTKQQTYSRQEVDDAIAQSGGGTGVVLNKPLSTINVSGLGAPQQSGVAIMWNGSAWVYQVPSSTGATSLSGLTDVNLSNLQTGQVLKYNSQTGKWYNGIDESGSSSSTVPTSGSSSNRPTSLLGVGDNGFAYYDTDLNQTIYFDCSAPAQNIEWALYTNSDGYDYLVYAWNDKVYIPYNQRTDEALVSDGGTEFMEYTPTSQAWQNLTSVIGGHYLEHTGMDVATPDGDVESLQTLNTKLSNNELPYYTVQSLEKRWLNSDGVDVYGVNDVLIGSSTMRNTLTQNLTYLNNGLRYYDTSLNKWVHWNGMSGRQRWEDENGYYPYDHVGSTSVRTSLTSSLGYHDEGYAFYDTDLSRMTYFGYDTNNNKIWYLADGTDADSTEATPYWALYTLSSYNQKMLIRVDSNGEIWIPYDSTNKTVVIQDDFESFTTLEISDVRDIQAISTHELQLDYANDMILLPGNKHEFISELGRMMGDGQIVDYVPNAGA